MSWLVVGSSAVDAAPRAPAPRRPAWPSYVRVGACVFYLADGPGDSSSTARGFQSTAPMGFLQSGVQILAYWLVRHRHIDVHAVRGDLSQEAVMRDNRAFGTHRTRALGVCGLSQPPHRRPNLNLYIEASSRSQIHSVGYSRQGSSSQSPFGWAFSGVMQRPSLSSRRHVHLRCTANSLSTITCCCCKCEEVSEPGRCATAMRSRPQTMRMHGTASMCTAVVR
ncbi:hypothetical protein K466DRAFT_96968 [Polyporus arcularius HHB13444]|uniref:Uncharacterized protein n=1 Tax=Polyporus arcularius HHB13444 TaxID=1314778 RepID=A0A5C3PP97_9APHY|nr:hypothetical protein K466DRAFT_96968 [Polyporus arcularius HHB13444]